MKHFEDLKLLKFVTYLLLQLNQCDSTTAIKKPPEYFILFSSS